MATVSSARSTLPPVPDERPAHGLQTRPPTPHATFDPLDGAARALITVGGIGTIVAVCAVFLFLFWVVKDLFLPARVGEPVQLADAGSAVKVLDAGLDGPARSSGP